MPHYKDLNNNLHFIASEFEHLLPQGAIEIEDSEAETIRLSQMPVPTMAELCEAVRIALQSAIDDKAKALGFSGGNALMLYAGFTNPFQTMAQTFATWEANVWVEAEDYKNLVIAGTEPMLTGEEAVAMMPTYP